MAGATAGLYAGQARGQRFPRWRARTVSIGSANCGGAPTKPRTSSLFQYWYEPLPPLAIETSSSIPAGRIGSTA